MLPYLSTDSKIRVMGKILKRLETEEKYIETLNHKELKKKLKEYKNMLKLYETKITNHAKKIIKEISPSKINRHVASVVAYSEIRKRLLKLIRKVKALIKLREAGKPISRRGIVKYLK